MNRRDFLGKVLPGLGILALAFPFYYFVEYLNTKKRIEIPIDELNKPITFFDEYKIFIIKNRFGYKIFDAHCTHMGCIVNYDDKNKLFECPCHGSVFNLKGERLKGPARKPLKQLTFKIVRNNLVIG